MKNRGGTRNNFKGRKEKTPVGVERRGVTFVRVSSNVFLFLSHYLVAEKSIIATTFI